jgi:hypothetical protein
MVCKRLGTPAQCCIRLNNAIHLQGETTGTLQHSRRVLACQPHGGYEVITGCEGGSIHIWDPRNTKTPIAQIESAHASRIRGLVADLADLRVDSAVATGAQGVSGKGSASMSGRQGWFATASSDGVVKLWDRRSCLAPGEAACGAIRPLASLDVGARFTGVCAVRDGGGAGAMSGAVSSSARGSKGAEAHGTKRKRKGQDASAAGNDVRTGAELDAAQRTGGASAQPTAAGDWSGHAKRPADASAAVHRKSKKLKGKDVQNEVAGTAGHDRHDADAVVAISTGKPQKRKGQQAAAGAAKLHKKVGTHGSAGVKGEHAVKRKPQGSANERLAKKRK